MKKTYDMLTDLSAGTPLWFSLAALALPFGPLAQVLGPGAALLRNGGLWGAACQPWWCFVPAGCGALLREFVGSGRNTRSLRADCD